MMNEINDINPIIAMEYMLSGTIFMLVTIYDATMSERRRATTPIFQAIGVIIGVSCILWGATYL